MINKADKLSLDISMYWAASFWRVILITFAYFLSGFLIFFFLLTWGSSIFQLHSPPDWGGTKQNQTGISLSAWAMENTLTMLRSSYEVSGFQQPYKIKEILKKSWKLRHFITKFSFLEAEQNVEREGMRERENQPTPILQVHIQE